MTHVARPATLLLALILVAGPAAAQTIAAAPVAAGAERGSIVRPTLLGGLAGLGLAVAHISPPGDGYILSDEAALPVAIAAGIAAGVLVHATTPADGADPRRAPRLVVALGSGSDMDFDYLLGYRVPAGDGGGVEIAIVATSETWERIERQTRCGGFLGCITGDFVVDHRYRQSVALLARHLRGPAPGRPLAPELALGGGPVLVRLDLRDHDPVRTTGLALDGGLAWGAGPRTRWTAELGARLVLSGSGDPAGRDMSGAYARVGFMTAALRGQPGER